jgi:3-oxoacyl-[acyl-carrier-protein] synthase II
VCSDRFDPRKVEGFPEDLRLSDHVNARVCRKFSRMAQYAGAALGLAAGDAALELAEVDPTRCVIVCATTNGCLGFSEEFFGGVLDEGPGAASPFLFCGGVLNAPAGLASLAFRFTGQTTTVVGTHAAGIEAAVLGRDLLAAGEADAVACVAGEEVTETAAGAYARTGFLAPGEAARHRAPRGGTGTVIREGGAAVLLEDRSRCEERGRVPYATLAGCGCIVGSAVGRDPEGSGLEAAVRQALAEAEVQPRAVAAVVPSANGTVLDAVEATVLDRVFGSQQPKRLAIRNLSGEGFSSTSLLAVAAGARSLRETSPDAAVLVTGIGGEGIYTAVVMTGVGR